MVVLGSLGVIKMESEMHVNQEAVKEIVKKVVRLLVKEKFDEIYKHDYAKHFQDDHLRESIKAYLAVAQGSKFVLPPESAYDNIEINVDDIDGFWINAEFDLWQQTDEGEPFEGSFVLGLDIEETNEGYRYSVVHLGL